MTAEENGSLQVEEIYRPPAADDAPLPHPSHTEPFYVVSRTKFLVLFFATFGGYQMYWFFTNWRRQRDRTGTKLYPFWRAIFSPLFAHALFAIIANDEAPAAPRFPASRMATLYVVLVIGSWTIDRVGDGPLFTLAGTALAMFAAKPLLAAQIAANAAAGDPEGASNSRMKGLNYVFIVLGVIAWPLAVLGMLTT